MHRILVGLAFILSTGFAGENKTTAQKPADALRALRSKNPADWDPVLLLALAFGEVGD